MRPVLKTLAFDRLRSPLSMPRHPAGAAWAARRVRRVFDVGVRIEMRPDGAHGFGHACRPGPLPEDRPHRRSAPMGPLFFHR